MIDLLGWALALVMYVAGACKTMNDYKIEGRMWFTLAIWPVFYAYAIIRSFWDVRG